MASSQFERSLENSEWKCRPMRFELRAKPEAIINTFVDTVESWPRTFHGLRKQFERGIHVLPNRKPDAVIIGVGSYLVKKDEYRTRLNVILSAESVSNDVTIADWETQSFATFDLSGELCADEENAKLREEFLHMVLRLDASAKDLIGDAHETEPPNRTRYFLK